MSKHDRQILVATESFSAGFEGADRHFVANHTLVREGHPVLAGIEHLFKPIVPHYEIDAAAPSEEKSLGRRAKEKVAAALGQNDAPPADPGEPEPPAPDPEEPEEPEEPTEPTLADRINAAASHADANALGLELGIEFADKKPSVAAKKTALHEAAAAATGDPGAEAE